MFIKERLFNNERMFKQYTVAKKVWNVCKLHKQHSIFIKNEPRSKVDQIMFSNPENNEGLRLET